MHIYIHLDEQLFFLKITLYKNINNLLLYDIKMNMCMNVALVKPNKNLKNYNHTNLRQVLLLQIELLLHL